MEEIADFSRASRRLGPSLSIRNIRQSRARALTGRERHLSGLSIYLPIGRRGHSIRNNFAFVGKLRGCRDVLSSFVPLQRSITGLKVRDGSPARFNRMRNGEGMGLGDVDVCEVRKI